MDSIYGQAASGTRRDVVNCTGTELDIFSCSHRNTSCYEFEAVAVSCVPGKDDLSSYLPALYFAL